VSNARKSGAAASSYRQGYLQSLAWKARRARWFREVMTRGRVLCAVCARVSTRPAREFELHHLSYRGVQARPGGAWFADEPDEDLMPMHPLCHASVHRLIDRDRVLSTQRTREVATREAIARVRSLVRRKLGAGGLG